MIRAYAVATSYAEWWKVPFSDRISNAAKPSLKRHFGVRCVVRSDKYGASVDIQARRKASDHYTKAFLSNRKHTKQEITALTDNISHIEAISLTTILV